MRPIDRPWPSKTSFRSNPGGACCVLQLQPRPNPAAFESTSRKDHATPRQATMSRLRHNVYIHYAAQIGGTDCAHLRAGTWHPFELFLSLTLTPGMRPPRDLLQPTCIERPRGWISKLLAPARSCTTEWIRRPLPLHAASCTREYLRTQ